MISPKMTEAFAGATYELNQSLNETVAHGIFNVLDSVVKALFFSNRSIVGYTKIAMPEEDLELTVAIRKFVE